MKRGFWRELFFRFGKAAQSTQGQEALAVGEEALRQKVLDRQAGEISATLSECIENCVNSLAAVDEAAIRIHNLLIVKVRKDGNSSAIIAHTLAPEHYRFLDSNPHLMQNPGELYTALSEIASTSSTKYLEGTG